MSDNLLDTIGQILWFGIFAAPLILLPLVWQYKTETKKFRIMLWLLLSFSVSVIFYFISISILFRDGLGPT
jgi:hypothetical protein